MAETYRHIGPYAFCGNNPINRVDPNGMSYSTASDPEAIRRALEAVQNGQIPDTSNWDTMTDTEYLDILEALKEQEHSEKLTPEWIDPITGQRDFSWYNPLGMINNVVGLGGTAATVVSMYDRPITFGSKYLKINSGGTIIRNPNRIFTSTTKIANKIGRNLYGISVVLDGIAVVSGKQTVSQAIVGISVNSGIYLLGTYCPPAAIVTGLFIMPMFYYSPNVILPYKEPIMDQDKTRFVTYPKLPLSK